MYLTDRVSRFPNKFGPAPFAKALQIGVYNPPSALNNPTNPSSGSGSLNKYP